MDMFFYHFDVAYVHDYTFKKEKFKEHVPHGCWIWR